MTDLDDLELPPDVAAVIAESQARTMARFEAFARLVADKRDEAVKAREASGIEAIWTAAEEAYLGIDDINRHEWDGQRWASWIKSPSMNGPLRARSVEDELRATAYVRVTARYVDAGAAKLGEILIPVDGKTFALTRTPVPELVAALEDDTQIVVDGQPQTRPPAEGEVPEGEQPQPKPLTVADLAENMVRQAEKAAEAASDWVQDWLVECKHPKTLRRALFDGARLGTMIVKGPIPERRKAMAVKTDGGLSLEMVSKLVPSTRWVNPWNFYPAPDCGDDPCSGSFVIEKDEMSARSLAALKEQDGYIGWAIDRVLKQGPGKCYEQAEKGVPVDRSKQFTVWYFWGVISAEDLRVANARLYREQADSIGREVYAIVTVVNDTPIKVAINPLKSGAFPHKVAVWRRRAGHWAGIGVAEQCKAAQAIINGGTRAMLNNGGKSAGSQIVMDDEVIVPADGRRVITPDKLWHKSPEAAMEDVRKAFAVFTIPNVTAPLMSIIEYGFKLAEESTSIPLVTQGQSGPTTPDTFGATQLQNNNANQLLRDVGFSVAEDITEPLIRDFYEWLLLDTSVPDDCKGDFQVDVSGSVALIEKAIQDQTITQMADLVSNPAFGIDPKRWIKEFLRSKRLNPASFIFSDEEQEQIDSQPQPKAPQVEAAEIRAQVALETAKSRDALIAEKTRVDTDRDRAYVESQARRDEAAAAARIEELRLKRDLKLMEFAEAERLSLQEAKARLAETAMKLSVQRELAGQDGEGPEVTTPPTEPPQHAPDGRAYQE